MRVLLVSAATPDTFWSYKHVLSFISKKACFPPLGLLTVAAMLPKRWDLKLVDLNVTSLTDAQLAWADYVFVSAMLAQVGSAREVIARCSKLGKTVVAGGPLFTTGHAGFPEVKHFVLGEAEDIMPELVADMISGDLKEFYRCEKRPDIRQTPVPRWDLIKFKHYATMPLQFSRGCPFNCEFCDIIVMNGRVPRLKTNEQMIGELESLVDAGWTGPIFIVDDNFIGNRAKVKEFLRELIAWEQRRGIRPQFTTEASLNLADDAELLDLMVRAGFKKVFVGIETPQEDSLLECAKVQNAKRDMLTAVKTIQKSGLEVMGGFIVGFDSDKPNIFERQIKFIQEAGVVTAMVGLLQALPGTRLFSRLRQGGPHPPRRERKQRRGQPEFRPQARSRNIGRGLPLARQAPLHAEDVLSAHPHVPARVSSAGARHSPVLVRREGVHQVAVDHGYPEPRPTPVLEVPHEGTALPPPRIPGGDDARDHRIPLPTRRVGVVARSELSRR